MNFEEVGRVLEIEDVEKVNKFLADGWVLLGTAVGVSRDGDGDRPFFRYSVGQLYEKE